jgi:hypothetical protein
LPSSAANARSWESHNEHSTPRRPQNTTVRWNRSRSAGHIVDTLLGRWQRMSKDRHHEGAGCISAFSELPLTGDRPGIPG